MLPAPRRPCPARVVALPCVAVALACGGPSLPSDLGEHPDDNVRLADSPALAHLAAALDSGGEVTAQDVIKDSLPAFARAPDPSELLAAERAEHEALPPFEDTTKLGTYRLLTYNTALLDRWYPLTTVMSPQIDARRAEIAELVLLGTWDIIVLQEVWEFQDVERFEIEADARGYEIYSGTDLHDQHGLVMLVRSAIIDHDAPQSREEVIFEQQRPLERFPGPGIARGFLAWDFTLAESGVKVRVYDTHLISYPDYWSVRASQARQLALHSREVGGGRLVLAGGDFNAAPYYPHDSFGAIDGEPTTEWWRNATAYALLLHYSGFKDIQNLAGTNDDIGEMDALAEFSEVAYLREPLGDPEACDEPSPTFSVTDCNSIYFEQYAATEYPGRIDFLLYRDRDERLRVKDAGLTYQQKRKFKGAGTFELSDHYGVFAEIEIAP